MKRQSKNVVMSKAILTLTEKKQDNFMKLIHCNVYKTLDKCEFGIIDCKATKTINNFYRDMYYLEELPEFRNAENLTSISGLCANCKSLKYIEGFFNTAHIEDFSEAFLNCAAIDEIPEVLDFSSMRNCKDMFKGCTNLKEVRIKNAPDGFDTSILGAPSECKIIIE